jgi:threonine dehydrogenase-like Zn-dependent dehydrogenase
VPDAVRDEEAVFVEPLAAAFQVVRQVPLDAKDKVVVLGDGRLAQLVARVLKARLKRMLLVGKHPAKLEAAEKQGIQALRVEEFVPAADADVVVEATGRPSGLDLAMRTVRPRGKIVLKSTFAEAEGLNLAPLVIHEITVVGSRCGPFPDALRALASGDVDVSALLSAEFALRDAPAAFDAAARGDHIKVLFDVQR